MYNLMKRHPETERSKIRPGFISRIRYLRRLYSVKSKLLSLCIARITYLKKKKLAQKRILESTE